MKLRNFALLGLLALEGDTEKPEPAKAELSAPSAPAAVIDAGYPESQLLGESVVYEKPAGLDMSQEEFEELAKGSSGHFATTYKQKYAKLSEEERRDQKHINELVTDVCRFLSERSGKKIDPYYLSRFPQGAKVELLDLVRFLNEFLHADGAHLQLRQQDKVWIINEYRFDQTDQIAIHDKLGAAKYPVLYIVENMTGELPAQTTAEGDTNGQVVQFYVNDQTQMAKRLAEDFKGYPGTQNPEEFEASLTRDTLHHEATHLLLVDRDKEVNFHQGCMQRRVDAEIYGMGTLHIENCFTPRQVQELCGYSAELAGSEGTGKWTLLDRVDDAIPPDAPDSLFVRLMQPYVVDRLSSENQGVIAEQVKTQGGFNLVDLKQFAAEDLTTTDVKAIGQRAYDECKRLTAELRTELNTKK